MMRFGRIAGSIVLGLGLALSTTTITAAPGWATGTAADKNLSSSEASIAIDVIDEESASERVPNNGTMVRIARECGRSAVTAAKYAGIAYVGLQAMGYGIEFYKANGDVITFVAGMVSKCAMNLYQECVNPTAIAATMGIATFIGTLNTDNFVPTKRKEA